MGKLKVGHVLGFMYLVSPTASKTLARTAADINDHMILHIIQRFHVTRVYIGYPTYN